MNHVEERFVTAGGQTIELRPLTRADVPHLLEIFEHMGPDSRYNRFHEVAAHLDDGILAGGGAGGFGRCVHAAAHQR